MMNHSETLKQTIRHNGFILSTLVSKDFKLKYRRSLLGVAWSILNPLLMMIVLSAVFEHIFRFNISNFPLYLILGNTLFGLMGNSSSSAMTSIIEASSLIKKIRIEKIIFPLEKIIFELLNFAVSLIAVVIVMIYYQIIPTAAILYLPLLIIYMVVFCTGLGLLLSSLAVFFRDIIHLWGVILTAWTYATPLFYPVDALAPWMIQIMQFNPMYHFVTYFRDILLYGSFPGLGANVICALMAIVTFIIGLVVFRKTERHFILFV